MTASAPPKPAADSAANGWKPELHDVPVDAITVAGNVRTAVDGLDQLTASVRANGVRSPIRVADIGAGQYELVYGQRRLAAAKAAGLATIPAIVDAEQPERDARVVDQLVENLQRADLNALDAATAYRWLLDQGLTQRALATRLGIAQPTIANTLALLKAPDELQARVAAGELTRSHVEAIVRLPKAEQAEVARRVVEHKLSTRDVESEIELAEKRQRMEDQRRDNERRALDGVVPKVETALAKHKVTKKSATVLLIADPKLLKRLADEGWGTVQERSATGVEIIYGDAVDECDALSIQWWTSWGSGEYPPEIHRACLVPAHRKAREADAQSHREAEVAKQREEERARQEANRAEMRKAVERVALALTAGDDADTWRLLLAAALAPDEYGGRDLIDRHVTNEADGDTIYDLDDPLWAAIERLSQDDLLDEVALFISERVGDGGRGRIDELLKGAKPKPAKRSKAKG